SACAVQGLRESKERQDLLKREKHLGPWRHPRARPSGHERNSIKKMTNEICRSSRAKPKLAFICIGQHPMLWLFRPLQGLSFYKGRPSYFWPQKYTQNPCLKSLPLRLVRMFFFCYRQIFVRRPFRLGKV